MTEISLSMPKHARCSLACLHRSGKQDAKSPFSFSSTALRTSPKSDPNDSVVESARHLVSNRFVNRWTVKRVMGLDDHRTLTSFIHYVPLCIRSSVPHAPMTYSMTASRRHPLNLSSCCRPSRSSSSQYTICTFPSSPLDRRRAHFSSNGT